MPKKSDFFVDQLLYCTDGTTYKVEKVGNKYLTVVRYTALGCGSEKHRVLLDTMQFEQNDGRILGPSGPS